MKFAVALLIAGLALAVGPGSARADDNADQQRFERWIHEGLLDPDAPTEQRKATVGEMDALTKDDSDPNVLYLLRSLYWQDPARSSTPVAQDIDRARELLSRAALRGRVLAMAKLSTLELRAGNRFEANVWAQLYYHYAEQDSRVEKGSRGNFAASILHNALSGFSESRVEELNRRVEAMLVQYDTQIRAGMAKSAASNARVQSFNPRLGNGKLMNPEKAKGRRLASGVAEYAIELGADGTVSEIWPLDAWPDPRLARALHKLVSGYRVDAEGSRSPAGTVQLLPMFFVDGRYSIRDQPAAE